MKVLRKISFEVFQKAIESFERKEYNFTTFFVKQEIEVFLKYLIVKRLEKEYFIKN